MAISRKVSYKRRKCSKKTKRHLVKNRRKTKRSNTKRGGGVKQKERTLKLGVMNTTYSPSVFNLKRNIPTKCRKVSSKCVKSILNKEPLSTEDLQKCYDCTFSTIKSGLDANSAKKNPKDTKALKDFYDSLSRKGFIENLNKNYFETNTFSISNHDLLENALCSDGQYKVSPDYDPEKYNERCDPVIKRIDNFKKILCDQCKDLQKEIKKFLEFKPTNDQTKKKEQIEMYNKLWYTYNDKDTSCLYAGKDCDLDVFKMFDKRKELGIPKPPRR